MLDQAKAMLADEDFEEAVKIYKRLSPVDPDFVEVQHDLGVCLANIPSKREGASIYFERGVEARYTESYYQLALARHRQQRFDEAVVLFDQYKLSNGRIVDDKEVDHRKAMSLSAKAPVSYTHLTLPTSEHV